MAVKQDCTIMVFRIVLLQIKGIAKCVCYIHFLICVTVFILSVGPEI